MLAYRDDRESEAGAGAWPQAWAPWERPGGGAQSAEDSWKPRDLA